jgi:putative flippase GtrA
MWWRSPKLCWADYLSPKAKGGRTRILPNNYYQPPASPTRNRRSFCKYDLEMAANKPKGQKRRFGIAGIINVLITNAALQALLASNLASIAIATLISQSINTILGYTIYGKLVFRAKGLRERVPVIRYGFLMIGMWLINAAGIELGSTLSLSKNVAAILMIPCLAVLSYITQKHWVFRK